MASGWYVLNIFDNVFELICCVCFSVANAELFCLQVYLTVFLFLFLFGSYSTGRLWYKSSRTGKQWNKSHVIYLLFKDWASILSWTEAFQVSFAVSSCVSFLHFQYSSRDLYFLLRRDLALPSVISQISLQRASYNSSEALCARLGAKKQTTNIEGESNGLLT